MNVHFHTAQNCKEYKYPLTGEWINWFGCIDIMRYCGALKRVKYSHWTTGWISMLSIRKPQKSSTSCMISYMTFWNRRNNLQCAEGLEGTFEATKGFYFSIVVITVGHCRVYVFVQILRGYILLHINSTSLKLIFFFFKSKI